MSRIRRSLSFSNVVAVMALFFALGGSAYAVAAGKIDGSQIAPSSIPGNRLEAKAVGSNQLKPSSIGNAQLKGNAVATKQLQSGAVTGGKIKAGSIGASQIQSGSITGTQVKSGSLGATQINQTTLTGISAANIHTVQYVGAQVSLVKESSAGTTGTAMCPSGMKVIGGGATTNNANYATVFESAPTGDRNGWFAAGYSGIAGVTMTITAICTPVATTTG
jgi:trimeric autotransporter adhesin